MSAARTDKELVARVQRGDKAAFDLLVRKYQHKVASLISRFVKDQSEVMDVSQEAFIKAYRAIHGFRGESAFYTWLYRIAVNTAKNYLASRSRRPPSSDIDNMDAENFGSADALREMDTPERLLMRDQLQELVFETLESLPDELKTALSLREFEGLSYEEIAEAMRCPVGTVRSRIFRARAAIDKAIAPLMKQHDHEEAVG
jgi:RNA polymerase sigma-70 factor (ECF subfamily)